jgi:membrane protein involved in colicin uptake
MEAMLPDIVAAFVAAGPLLVVQRRQFEEAERQRQMVERQRYEEQQRRKLEHNRWRRFVEIAREWREARTARAFLQALKTAEMDLQQEITGKSAADWIAWAEASLVHADPLNHGADAIFSEIARVTAWTYRD